MAAPGPVGAAAQPGSRPQVVLPWVVAAEATLVPPKAGWSAPGPPAQPPLSLALTAALGTTLRASLAACSWRAAGGAAAQQDVVPKAGGPAPEVASPAPLGAQGSPHILGHGWCPCAVTSSVTLDKLPLDSSNERVTAPAVYRDLVLI